MKVVKINFNEKNIAQNPLKSFDRYSEKVLDIVKRNSKVDRTTFVSELKVLGDVFEKKNEKTLMNKKTKKLAETLVSLKNQDLAGIVYSFLVKFNKGDDKLVEEFATNALAIAVRLKDYVHIQARAGNLKELYKRKEYGSDKHLNAIYQQKKALNEVIRSYDSVKQNQRTIKTEMKPIENYEASLAAVKLEIAELIMAKDKNSAKAELLDAQAIYKKLGVGKNSQRIEELLKQL